MRPLRGPRALGGASTEGMTGYVQTTASPFGLWQWQFTFALTEGMALRRLRGMMTALHGGANAVRVTFRDPDRRDDESGIVGQTGIAPWSNGQTWSNGQHWQAAPPVVALASASASGASYITLSDQHWANEIGVGDWLGFMPFYFGLHTVTEVQDDLTFRVWPPIRAALSVDHYATLEPTMAMRLMSEDGAIWSRDSVAARDASITLLEVQDADVRDYFTD